MDRAQTRGALVPDACSAALRMADIFTRRQRSAVMARVRSRGNQATELRMASLLRIHRLGGWRRGAILPGRPDFVWHHERVALFVDGCFWHRCPRHGSIPASRQNYWEPKLARNVSRGKSVGRVLRAAGWKVVRVWECALAHPRDSITVRRIARALRNG